MYVRARGLVTVGGTVQLAIVGAGSMGRNHGRVAMGIRDATVAVVVDPSEEAGKALAAACGADYASSIDDIGGVDAAVLSVPTEHHRPMGVALLERGIHLLVEKPISRTIDDATALVEAADAAGVVLMVGHVERFNPPVAELIRMTDEPLHFEAHRISPYTPRITDGVILDLMIHDLDIARRMANSAVVGLDAMALTMRSDSEDLAVALLRFESGMRATITASRLGQQKIRRLAVTERDVQIEADLLTRALTVRRVGTVEEGEVGGSYRQVATVEEPFLPPTGEPLFLELQHFVSCVMDDVAPEPSGRDGRAALALALDVIAAAEEGLTPREPLSLP